MGKSHDLARGVSSLYQTQTASDTRYVNATGDTMSGTLNVNGGNLYLAPDDAAAHRYMFLNTGASQDGHIVLQRGLANKYQVTALQDNSYSIYSYPAGGEVFNIDGSGYVTIPNQPCFHAKGLGNSASGYGSSGGNQVLVFNGTTINNGNHYSTSNGRFTAPCSGFFYFSFSLLYDDSYNNNGSAKLRKNGSNIGEYGYVQGDSNTYIQVSASAVVSMSLGDYVDVHSSPAGWHVASETSFTGFMIG